MNRSIRKATVIGAGVMGSGIAAHLANAGISVNLLDIVPRELTAEEKGRGLTLNHKLVRNRFAENAIKGMLRSKASPFYDKEKAYFVHPGNLEDDINLVADSEIVIEAVTEVMGIKKDLLEKLANVCSDKTIIGSNTSGLSINEMAMFLPETHRKNFLGLHFFNPPRYMKLLEIIPSKYTSKEVVDKMSYFASNSLGKGVVLAKDTPNFIANRIGVYANIVSSRTAIEMKLTVEEADAIAGTPLARPKSGIFRTCDMVGVDVGMLVAKNLQKTFTNPKEQKEFEPMPLNERMVEKNLLGNKTGQGFYKKTIVDGEKVILSLDYDTLEYSPQKNVVFESLKQAKKSSSPKEAFASLVFSEDLAGKFAWQITKKTLVYAAEHAEEISDTIYDIDNGLKWGFNWSMGPFEQWDALGIERVAEKIMSEGEEVPELIGKLIDGKLDSFYKSTDEGEMYFDFATSNYKLMPSNKSAFPLKQIKSSAGLIRSSSEMSFVDMGDGIALLQMHTLNNVAPSQSGQMMKDCLKNVEDKWNGLVISSAGKDFCIGANLKEFNYLIEEKKWDDLEKLIYEAQQSMMALKYCSRPIVAAVHGRALGGGAEMLLHTHKVKASSEAMIGLVEAGVGLIPAGGGLTEMTIRSSSHCIGEKLANPMPYINNAFTNICMGAVSNGGYHAKRLGFLRKNDEITMNQSGLLREAKETALHMERGGWNPFVQKPIEILGQSGYASLCAEIEYIENAGYISPYSKYISQKIAYILTGGNLPSKSKVTEQYLLDLEREVFLHLCGQQKTQDRIQYMLKTGKRLNN